MEPGLAVVGADPTSRRRLRSGGSRPRGGGAILAPLWRPRRETRTANAPCRSRIDRFRSSRRSPHRHRDGGTPEPRRSAPTRIHRRYEAPADQLEPERGAASPVPGRPRSLGGRQFTSRLDGPPACSAACYPGPGALQPDILPRRAARPLGHRHPSPEAAPLRRSLARQRVPPPKRRPQACPTRTAERKAVSSRSGRFLVAQPATRSVRSPNAPGPGSLAPRCSRGQRLGSATRTESARQPRPSLGRHELSLG